MKFGDVVMQRWQIEIRLKELLRDVIADRDAKKGWIETRKQVESS